MVFFKRWALLAGANDGNRPAVVPEPTLWRPVAAIICCCLFFDVFLPLADSPGMARLQKSPRVRNLSLGSFSPFLSRTSGPATEEVAPDSPSQVPPFFQEVRKTAPEQYKAFVQVMKDFKARKITTAQVADRAAELFEGHPALVEGFNMFLPKKHRLILVDDEEEDETPPIPMRAPPKLNAAASDEEDEEEESSKDEEEEETVDGDATLDKETQAPPVPASVPVLPAVKTGLRRDSGFVVDVEDESSSSQEQEATVGLQPFFQKVKTTYADRPETYRRFLGALKEYHDKSCSADEVVAVVEQLFQGQPQLVRDFNQFVPKKHRLPVAVPEKREEEEGEEDEEQSSYMTLASETGDFSAFQTEGTGDRLEEEDDGSYEPGSSYDEDEDEDEDDDSYDSGESIFNQSSRTVLAVQSLGDSLALLHDEIVARNDTAIIRVCRTCTQKVMELIAEADEDDEVQGSIHEHIVALNSGVMELLKSSYGEQQEAMVMGQISELEVIYSIDGATSH